MSDRLVGVGIGVALCGLVAAVTVSADQPHMEKALNHLSQAATELEQAKANKGGHREKALELVNQAMEQVRKGMATAAD